MKFRVGDLVYIKFAYSVFLWEYPACKNSITLAKDVKHCAVFLGKKDSATCFLLVREKVISLDWLVYNLRSKFIQGMTNV